MVRPKNNMLRKKLYRDMSRAAMQFLSIIALCALGTFAFSALDGTARMIRTTLNTYYEETTSPISGSRSPPPTVPRWRKLPRCRM